MKATSVLDASAVLAFLQGEPGAGKVLGLLESGTACGAANWAEVAQKIRAQGRDWGLSRALLQSFAMEVEPVTEADAEWAAARWRIGEGLSLADRLCLAVGHRTGVESWTADTGWSDAHARPIR